MMIGGKEVRATEAPYHPIYHTSTTVFEIDDEGQTLRSDESKGGVMTTTQDHHREICDRAEQSCPLFLASWGRLYFNSRIDDDDVVDSFDVHRAEWKLRDIVLPDAIRNRRENAQGSQPIMPGICMSSA
jgi:hypothetical protein